MLSSTKILYKAIMPYLNKGYSFCPDTNILMAAPELFEKLKGESIFVSKQVYDELDNLKKVDENASYDQRKRSFEAREGLRAMDYSDSKIIDMAPSSTHNTYNLSFSPDEKIIATYIHERDTNNKNIIFLTLDRGAKMIAKSKGLGVVEFDLEMFQKRRKSDQVILKEKQKRSNLSPMRRFGKSVSVIHKKIMKLLKFGLGIAVVLFLLSAFVLPAFGSVEVAEVEPIKLENDQITIIPKLVYQDPYEEKFYIHYEIMNKMNSAIYGFYNPDRPLELKTKSVPIEKRLKQMQEKQHYSNQLFLDQIYVKFKGREDENVFAFGSPDKVPTKERRNGIIEVEGNLKDLIELNTSVFIVDSEQRIPYSIKLGEIKKVKNSEIKKMK